MYFINYKEMSYLLVNFSEDDSLELVYVGWLRGSIIFCAIKFQPRIYLVYSQVKRHENENVSFQIDVF